MFSLLYNYKLSINLLNIKERLKKNTISKKMFSYGGAATFVTFF